jgi:hypothetical protein
MPFFLWAAGVEVNAPYWAGASSYMSSLYLLEKLECRFGTPMPDRVILDTRPAFGREYWRQHTPNIPYSFNRIGRFKRELPPISRKILRFTQDDTYL